MGLSLKNAPFIGTFSVKFTVKLNFQAAVGIFQTKLQTLLSFQGEKKDHFFLKLQIMKRTEVGLASESSLRFKQSAIQLAFLGSHLVDKLISTQRGCNLISTIYKDRIWGDKQIVLATAGGPLGIDDYYIRAAFLRSQVCF